MVADVYSHPRDCDERLERLGVTRKQLIDVVKECVAGRGGATDNDPRSAGGQFAWIYGTRRLRAILRSLGWEKEIFNGLETVVHRNRKIRIAVGSFDEGTADPDRSPRNRTEKGSASELVTDLNLQYELPGVATQKDEGDGYSFWYLCIFDDGSNVRAELSSPIEFKSGYFIKFSERIFIIKDGEWGAVNVAAPEDGPDLQIDVRRK